MQIHSIMLSETISDVIEETLHEQAYTLLHGGNITLPENKYKIFNNLIFVYKQSHRFQN